MSRIYNEAIVASAIALASSAAAFLQISPLALLSTIAGAAFLYLPSAKSHDGDREKAVRLEAFIEKMKRYYSEKNNLSSAIARATPIYPRMGEALKRIMLLGRSADIGSCMNHHESELLRIVGSALHTGSDVSSELDALLHAVSYENRKRIGSIGAVRNAMWVNSASSFVFFPAFSGISLGIIKFSSFIGQGTGSINPNAMIIAFTGYIALAGIVEYSASRRSVLAAAFFFSLGVTILLLSAMVSMEFIQL